MATTETISKVGALLFAAGVGAAILGNSGVASADTRSTTKDTASQSDSSESGGDSTPDDADTPSTNATDDTEASDEPDHSEDAPEPDPADDDVLDDDADSDQDADVDETPVDDTADVPEDVDEPTITTAVPDTAPTATPEVESPLPDTDESQPQQGVVSTVLRWFGWTPLIQSTPTTPEPESPVSWTLLSWVRRQLFNGTPTAESQQLLYNPSNGTVVGRINAVDPEGDSLMWRLVEGPRHGTVTLGADGSYNYTPDAGFAEAGGVDTFIVKVRDAGLHLHLFNGTGQTLVAVPVTITPTEIKTGSGLTLGFDVINLTSHPIRFEKYSTHYDLPESGPKLGQVFAPGEAAHFELIRPFWESRVDAYFVATDGSGVSFWVGMDSQSLFGVGQVTCRASGRAACNPSQWSVGTIVGMMDPAGTVIKIGPNSPAAQRDVLNGLCNYQSQSTCEFKPLRQEEVWTPFRQISSTLTNPTPVNQTISEAFAHAVSQSDSVSVSTKVGFKLTDIVNFEINTTYGHTWTSTETYTETVTLTVPPNYQGWINFRDRVYRVYGTFTLTMADTTWIIEDTFFDTPMPGKENGEFKPHVQPVVPVL